MPRVDGQLAVARAFGDKSLKRHLSADPHIEVITVDDITECVILASDGLWKVSFFHDVPNVYFSLTKHKVIMSSTLHQKQVMSNQEAVNAIKEIKDAKTAAKTLTDEALARKSSDDISCIVIKFL